MNNKTETTNATETTKAKTESEIRHRMQWTGESYGDAARAIGLDLVRDGAAAPTGLLKKLGDALSGERNALRELEKAQQARREALEVQDRWNEMVRDFDAQQPAIDNATADAPVR